MVVCAEWDFTVQVMTVNKIKDMKVFVCAGETMCQL